MNLKKYLRSPLPPNANPPKSYQGKPRLIVPTVRTILNENENLNLKAMVLTNTSISSVSLYVRKLGSTVVSKYSMPRITGGRDVYKIILAPQKEDFEYYIEAIVTAHDVLVFPVTVPEKWQVVVIRNLV